VFPPITLRERCIASARGAAPAPPGSDTVAAQHAAFDAQQAEHAEMLRELAALEDLMMAQLKNEDEILKKWIAMI
jgi:hypothetical protein